MEHVGGLVFSTREGDDEMGDPWKHIAANDRDGSAWAVAKIIRAIGAPGSHK